MGDALTVTAADVQAALADLGEEVAEGTVGSGTGMTCFDFAGGIGTASRVVEGYTVGVLLMCNFGDRERLTVGGSEVRSRRLGRRPRRARASPSARPTRRCRRCSSAAVTAAAAGVVPGRVVRLATARARSLWPSPWPRRRSSTTRSSHRCLRPPTRRPRNPCTTAWSRPRRACAATAVPTRRFPSISSPKESRR